MADLNQIIEQEAQINGLDPKTLRAFIQIESGGRPDAQTGSYSGLLQLSPSEFARYGGAGNIFDPVENVRVGARKLRAESDRFASKYGRKPSATDLYLTHQQGEGGYASHAANPDQPAWVSMYQTAEGRAKGPGWAKRAIWGNVPSDVREQFGTVDNVSSRDFMALWGDKVERFGSKELPAVRMASALRRKFAPKTEGGATTMTGSAGDATMAGGSGVDRLRSVLSGKSYDPDRLAGYENLAKTGQDVASKAQNWQQALLGVATAGVGGYLKDQEKVSKKEFETAFAEAVKDVKSTAELGQILVMSPDEKLRNAGLEILSKNLGQSPQITTIETKDQYGRTVKTPVIPDGQGGYKPVEIGGGNQTAPEAPQAAPQPVEAQAAPMAAPQPSPAPGGAVAPSGPMLGSQEMPAQNIGQVGPSGIPQPQQAPAPQVVQQPATQQIPSGFREAPVNVNELPKPAEGMTYDMGPNGLPLFNDATKSFKMVSTAEAAERGKAQAGLAAEAQSRAQVAKQFAGGLSQLQRFPEEFGDTATERALGPWSGTNPPTEDEKGGFWGTGLSVNSIGQNLARGWGELRAAVEGGAAPTEVRDRIDTATKNLAAVMKPLIRKPGEGAWSDKDQANLEAQLGALTRSRSIEEYNRRLGDIRENVSKIFLVDVPEPEKRKRSTNAPDLADSDRPDAEADRRAEQERFYREWFAKNQPPAPAQQQASAIQGTPYVVNGPNDVWAQYMKQFGF